MGADDYLAKPFISDEMILRVTNILSRIDLTRTKAEKKMMESTLAAAQEVHRSLGGESRALPGISIADHYQPAEITGGDWFGYYFDQATVRLYVMIGDVTGHGVTSAFVTVAAAGSVNGALFAIRERGQGASMQENLETLAKAVNEAIIYSGKKINRSMTMAFLCLDLATGEAVYVNAGHNSIFVIGQEKIYPMLTPGSVLGSDEFDIKPKTLHLKEGESIFFFTDGLIENTGPQGKTLREKSLHKLMVNQRNVEELKSTILHNGQLIWQNNPPEDDCTFLIVKWEGPHSEIREPSTTYDPATGWNNAAKTCKTAEPETCLQNASYRHRADGRLVSARDQGVEKSYAYSLRGELLQATIGSETFTNTYDAAGNALKIGDSPFSELKHQGLPLALPKDGSCKLDGFGRVKSCGSLQDIAYDPLGRIRRLKLNNKSLAFGYSALGRRISRETIGQGQLITYPTTTTRDNGEERQSLIHLGGTPAVMIVNEEQVFSLLTNQLGIVQAVVAENGAQVLSSWRHTPYGHLRQTSPPTQLSLSSMELIASYTGQLYDQDSGLVHMGARDYLPALGAFLTPDPYFLANPEQCIVSPLECNLYTYVGHDPINFVDKTGLSKRPKRNRQTKIRQNVANAHRLRQKNTKGIRNFGKQTHRVKNTVRKSQTTRKQNRNFKWGKKTNATKGVVKPGDTGTYGQLKAQKRKHGETEALDMDHQPSFAAQVKAIETARGRRLTPAELSTLKKNTPAVASPRKIHQQTSPTYGGRNTPARVAEDAADLNAAASRDRTVFDEAMKTR